MLDKITSGPQRVSSDEESGRQIIMKHMSCLPEDELQLNLGLFIEPRLLSRMLFLNHIFQKILPLQGIVLDLGTRWGQNAIIMQTLRCIYEPFNYQRKIVAFDTFQGFLGTTDKDGDLERYTGITVTSADYQNHLDTLMSAHEQLHPLNHIKKYQIVPGDVRLTVDQYLQDHPETLISLAFFDLDLYEPTLIALRCILPRMSKGSILVFDELNYPGVPGETLAVLDELEINDYRIQRFPFCSRVSFIEI